MQTNVSDIVRKQQDSTKLEYEKLKKRKLFEEVKETNHEPLTKQHLKNKRKYDQATPPEIKLTELQARKKREYEERKNRQKEQDRKNRELEEKKDRNKREYEERKNRQNSQKELEEIHKKELEEIQDRKKREYEERKNRQKNSNRLLATKQSQNKRAYEKRKQHNKELEISLLKQQHSRKNHLRNVGENTSKNAIDQDDELLQQHIQYQRHRYKLFQ